MKNLSLIILLSFFSYAQELNLKNILGMTSGATVMPTILPTYVTVVHFNPPPGTKHREKIEKFMKENFEHLKEQIAKGEGEHLETLALLYELDDIASWKAYLQSHFEEIYKEDNSKEEILRHIDNITYSNFKFAKPITIKEPKRDIDTRNLDGRK